MSANVETCFVTKVPAWHGLGTVVAESPTSIDTLRLAGLDWEVKPEPIYLKDGTEVPERVANLRSSDHSILGIVSDHYKIVQNVEAFSFVDELLKGEGEEKVLFESAGSLNYGKRVWMLAHLPAKNILGDEIVPYLVFSNSHDGSSAVQSAMTPTRVVCQNTLNLALNSAKRVWTNRHMGDIEGKKKDAAMTLGLAFKYMDGLEMKAEEYQQKKVSKEMLDDILDLVFPIDEKETERQINNVKIMRNTFMTIWADTDNILKFKNDAWGVYNAFADFASHIQPLRKTDTYQEKLFGSLIDGNAVLKSAQAAIEKVVA